MHGTQRDHIRRAVRTLGVALGVVPFAFSTITLAEAPAREPENIRALLESTLERAALAPTPGDENAPGWHTAFCPGEGGTPSPYSEDQEGTLSLRGPAVPTSSEAKSSEAKAGADSNAPLWCINSRDPHCQYRSCPGGPSQGSQPLRADSATLPASATHLPRPPAVDTVPRHCMTRGPAGVDAAVERPPKANDGE